MSISVDRYLAVARPMDNVTTADRRGRAMLAMSWLLSVVASVPQVCTHSCVIYMYMYIHVFM
jgi:hypothetical protein